jgi:hypothetical protein
VSATTPELSVVIASVNGFPYLADCLDALAAHCPDAEVIVAEATGKEAQERIAARWASVRVLPYEPPRTVPELRAAGVFAAAAPNVALIEDHCVVQPGWAEGILAGHRRGEHVVGGPIRNTQTRRIRDWAAFFCEYNAFLEPGPRGPAEWLPGMNVSYDREAIAAIDDLLREGRWETWLHARLRERGFTLYADPDVVVGHDKDFGFWEFVGQRYHYSRAYAGMRNPDLGWKRILYTLGSPALVPVIFARLARKAKASPPHRAAFNRATPLILFYTCVWAFGEAVGYALGGGRSLLRVR